jgi:hypothetical protein
MTTLPTIVRASSLTNYPDCPRRAATRMIGQEIKAAGYDLRGLPNGIGAAVGTSVHRAASLILDEKAKSGSVPPLDVSADAAIETLRNETAPGISMDSTTVDLNEAEQQVLRMSAVYRRDVAPDIRPLLVETRIEATVPWSTQGLVLTGQGDVIAREPGRVRDLKTGTKLKTHGPQIGAYSLLARSNGIEINEVGIDFIQRVHITSRTKCQSQPAAVIQKHNIQVAETAAANVLRHIDGDIAVFRNGDPERRLLPGDPWAFAANPSSVLCSPKYCPAHGTPWCREATTEEE